MDSRRVAELAWRLILAYAAALVFAGVAGMQIGAALLPVLRTVVCWMIPDVSAAQLDLEILRGEPRFVLLAIKSVATPAGGAAQNLVFTGSTLLGHALQHLVVMSTLLFAWPGISGVRRIVLWLLALPVLLLVECVDVPVVLGGNVADAMARTASSAPGISPLLLWIDFLGNGGRIVLWLGAALATIAMYRAIDSRLATRIAQGSSYSPQVQVR